MDASALTISGLDKAYGSNDTLKGIDLDVRPGEFLTLVGPSGCGKSTLLKIVAGLERPDRGRLSITGRDITHLPPSRRELAMVFQNYALYPHMSVAENLSMPLLMRQMSFFQRFPLVGRLSPAGRHKRVEIAARVGEVAEALEISALLRRRPGELSGGQRQRVALGRAIVRRPSLFLMDEPLSNLDARLRLQMRDELTALHRKLGIAFIYVTHDQIEAMTMSSRIAVMMAGRIVQLGSPGEIYDRPASLDVARFFGSSPVNVLAADIDPSQRPVLFGRPLPVTLPASAGRTVHVAIRPEDVRFRDARHPDEEAYTLEVTPVRQEDHGAETVLHVTTLSDPPVDMRMRMPKGTAVPGRPTLQDTIELAFPVSRMHVFGADGNRIETGAAVAAPAQAVKVMA